jgi:hypothetical protein
MELRVDFTQPGAAIPAALTWRPSAPAAAAVGAGGLRVQPAPDTDAWARTHYGFVHTNAQALGLSGVTGDFVATTRVTMWPRLQYDQAGLVVHVDDDTWLKASCEYIPGGPHKLGSVVTQHGFSDWATAPLADSGAGDAGLAFELRVARLGEAFLVHTRRSADEPWFLARLARLPSAPSVPAHVGLYACCPTGDGGHAVFGSFEVRPPREGEVSLHG